METQEPFLGQLLPEKCQQLLFGLCGRCLLLITGVSIALRDFGHEHQPDESMNRSSGLDYPCTRLAYYLRLPRMSRAFL